MPRELMHWHLLEECQSKNRLAKLPAVKEALAAESPAAYLGAIAHDAPYYYKWGKSWFALVASSLHGAYGEDTFEPLKNLAIEIAESKYENKKTLWAFFLGMITHHVLDINFHPLVYFFTGNYNDPDPKRKRNARQKHRLMEVYLDSWCDGRFGINTDKSISKMLDAVDDDFDEIINLLEHSIGPKNLPSILDKVPSSYTVKGKWRAGFNTTARCQKMFYSPTYGFIVRGINMLTKGRILAADGLFSFRRREVNAVFDEPIAYQNPYTGEAIKISPKAMIEKSVNESYALFELCEPLVSGQINDVESVLGGVRGNSLNVGVYKISEQQATHYSKDSFPLKGLELDGD